MARNRLPAPRDLLKFHTRWNERPLQPYEEELTELWAQNGISAYIENSVQGPMMVRFAVTAEDMTSAGRIMKLIPTYKAIFRRRDIRVYRSEGRILIDIPWQHDTVCLGDLLNVGEYLESEGLPLGIGMNLYRESILDDLTDIPHLLVAASPSSGIDDYLEGLLISALMKVTPDEVEFTLLDSISAGLLKYSVLPYCSVISSHRQMMTFLTDIEDEIDRRYAIFLEKGCHNIYDYNEAGGIMRHRFLMITEYDSISGSGRRSAERFVRKAAELGGNCGIHVILASAKPACLGPVRDLFPAKVCLRVDSAAESLGIIGIKGAEQLNKRGGLYYLDGHNVTPVLLQSGAISTREARAVIDDLSDRFGSGRRRSIFEEIDEIEENDDTSSAWNADLEENTDTAGSSGTEEVINKEEESTSSEDTGETADQPSPEPEKKAAEKRRGFWSRFFS